MQSQENITKLINTLQSQIKAGANLKQPEEMREHRQKTAKFLTNPEITKEVLNGYGTDGDTPLITAVKSGNRYMVTLLLIAGAALNCKNEEGETALHRVLTNLVGFSNRDKDLAIIRVLVEAGLDSDGVAAGRKWLESCGRSKESVKISFAFLDSTPESLRKEAEADASSLTAFFKGDTPHTLDMRLLNAMQVNDVQKVNNLLAQGADPNRYSLKDEENYVAYPLHFATSLGNEEVMEVLINYGAYPKHSGAPFTRPPIYLAGGHESKIAKKLIEHGADVNAQVSGGSLDRRTALHPAFEQNRIKTIKLLLDNKANPAALGKFNFIAVTPLQSHFVSNTWETILPMVLDSKELKEYDIGINAISSTGETPLMMLARRKASVELINKFIERPGIDLNIVDYGASTALHSAVYAVNLPMVKALCKVRTPDGAIPGYMNVRDRYGFTAVDTACFKMLEVGSNANNFATIIGHLIDNGADMNAWAMYGPDKYTPLIYLLRKLGRTLLDDSKETIVLDNLYSEQVDEGKVLETLKAAMHGNNNRVINYILDKGVDLTKVNKAGEIVFFELLELAVDNNPLLKRLIELGRGLGEYSNKERVLKVVAGINAEASNFLISIGADPFLPVYDSSNDTSKSACEVWSNKNELVAQMIYSRLNHFAYTVFKSEEQYKTEIEKIYTAIPAFNKSDDASEKYQNDILSLIQNHVLKLVDNEKNVNTRLAILNRAIGSANENPDTFLSRFLRESVNEKVISTLRRQLCKVLGKGAASVHNAPPEFNAQAFDEYAQQVIEKPAPLTAVTLTPQPYSCPELQAPASAPAVPVVSLDENALFVNALKAVDEKHHRELEELKQQHQAEIASLRAQMENPDEKDREINALKKQLEMHKLINEDQFTQIVRLKAQVYAAGEVLGRPVIFSGSSQESEPKDRYEGTPSGVRVGIKK